MTAIVIFKKELATLTKQIAPGSKFDQTNVKKRRRRKLLAAQKESEKKWGWSKCNCLQVSRVQTPRRVVRTGLPSRYYFPGSSRSQASMTTRGNARDTWQACVPASMAMCMLDLSAGLLLCACGTFSESSSVSSGITTSPPP